MFNHPRHRGLVQHLQFRSAGHGGNHLGIQHVTVIIPIQIVFEVCFHLKQVQKVRIVMRQQVIQHTVAQQNHLHLQRNRLRLLTDRGGQSIQTLQRFNPNFTGKQNTLQALPGQRLCQNTAGIQNQVATVGAVQRATANQSKICIQSTLVSFVFDLSGQMLMGGQIFIHNWGALSIGIIHQKIDPVAIQQASGHAIFTILKRRCVFNHILTHCIHMGHRRRHMGPFFTQFTDRATQRELHHFFIQCLNALTHFFTQTRNLLNRLLKLFL